MSLTLIARINEMITRYTESLLANCTLSLIYKLSKHASHHESAQLKTCDFYTVRMLLSQLYLHASELHVHKTQMIKESITEID